MWKRLLFFVCFIDFFALLSARFNFQRGKINKRNKKCSFPRSENEPLSTKRSKKINKVNKEYYIPRWYSKWAFSLIIIKFSRQLLVVLAIFSNHQQPTGDKHCKLLTILTIFKFVILLNGVSAEKFADTYLQEEMKHIVQKENYKKRLPV